MLRSSVIAEDYASIFYIIYFYDATLAVYRWNLDRHLPDFECLWWLCEGGFEPPLSWPSLLVGKVCHMLLALDLPLAFV